MSILGPVIGAAGGMLAARPRLQQWMRKRANIERAQSVQTGRGRPAKRGKMSRTRITQGMARRGRKRFGRRRRRVFRPQRAPLYHPYTMVRRLKTVAPFTLDPSAGSVGSSGGATQVLLKLNSAFDPMGNLGTGQPLFYDQMTALYNYSCVVAWKVYVEFASAADDTTAVLVGFTPTTSGTTTTYCAYYKEMKGTKSAFVTKDTDRATLAARGSVKKWLMPLGGKILSEKRLQALTGEDPEQLLYGHLWAGPVDQLTNVGAINGMVTIVQTVVWFNPVVPSRSVQ